jgi:hypothetical protein
MTCPTERKIARTSRGDDIYAYIDRNGHEQHFIVPPGYFYTCENDEWIVYHVPSDPPRNPSEAGAKTK